MVADNKINIWSVFAKHPRSTHTHTRTFSRWSHPIKCRIQLKFLLIFVLGIRAPFPTRYPYSLSFYSCIYHPHSRTSSVYSPVVACNKSTFECHVSCQLLISCWRFLVKEKYQIAAAGVEWPQWLERARSEIESRNFWMIAAKVLDSKTNVHTMNFVQWWKFSRIWGERDFFIRKSLLFTSKYTWNAVRNRAKVAISQLCTCDTHSHSHNFCFLPAGLIYHRFIPCSRTRVYVSLPNLKCSSTSRAFRRVLAHIGQRFKLNGMWRKSSVAFGRTALHAPSPMAIKCSIFAAQPSEWNTFAGIRCMNSAHNFLASNIQYITAHWDESPNPLWYFQVFAVVQCRHFLPGTIFDAWEFGSHTRTAVESAINVEFMKA